MIEKVIPINTDPSGITQYLTMPYVLGAMFFAAVVMLIYKLMPKGLLLVLVAVAVVLFFAYHGTR